MTTEQPGSSPHLGAAGLPAPPGTAEEPTAALGRMRSDSALRLLDAAEAVFAQHGFAGATTAAIAARAGVTKALVHYYFGTKEALHRAVLERYERVVSRLLLADLDRREPVAALSDSIRRYCRFQADHPRYVRLGMYEALEQTGHSPRTSIYRKLIDDTAAALRRGMEQGVFRPEDPRRLLLSICALCSFFFEHETEVQQILDSPPAERAREVSEHTEHVVRLVLSGIHHPGTEAENR